jgi:hypothetical protein
MERAPELHEVYGVTSRQTQHRIIDVLRRKRNLAVAEDRRDGRRVVIVECPDALAQWVFRKVTSIDPDAVLIQATPTVSA